MTKSTQPPKRVKDRSRYTATGKNYKLMMVKRNWALYLFILPAFTYFLIFSYLPMVGIQIAFKDFLTSKKIFGSEWADPLFKHFTNFINSPKFLQLFTNTIKLSLYYLVVSFPIPIILALMINEVKSTRYRKLVQNITYIPYFISVVVLVGMIGIFFSQTGLFNILLGKFFGIKPIQFLAKANMFDDLYVWSGVWQTAGYGSVVYFAALSGVSQELHEAATIDGATRIQRIWHINLPAITPTIVIMLIMSVGGVMNLGFEKIFLMQNAANMSVSQVLTTYVYEIGIKNAEFSPAAAIGLFNNVINLILLVTVNKIANKVGNNGLW